MPVSQDSYQGETIWHSIHYIRNFSLFIRKKTKQNNKNNKNKTKTKTKTNKQTETNKWFNLALGSKKVDDLLTMLTNMHWMGDL